MHVVLRSTQAKGKSSFLHSQNKKKINDFVKSFSKQKHIEILNFANVGNHLHLHVKVLSRELYNQWIRGLTSAIAMYATGLEGLKRLKQSNKTFWDQRPFTKLIQSFKHFQKTQKYVEINLLESMGYPRKLAEFYIHEIWKDRLVV